ncbi:MAG: hypothetical protein ACTSRZ_04010 [Promethearchaeota archaeon]
MTKEQSTKCVLVKIEKSISFPDEIYNELTKKAQYIIAILPNNLRKIVLFPTNTEMGLYTKINLKRKSKLDDTFFIKLRKKLNNFSIKTLYTTGVCFSKDECFWEGVFEYKKDFPLERFIEDLKTIDSVESVFTQILKAD